MKRSMMVGAAGGLLAGASIATLVLAAPSYAFKNDGQASPAAITAAVGGNVTATAVGQLNRWGTLPNLADLVQQTAPSVVQIKVREDASIRTARGPQGLDQLPPEMRQFFGRQFGLGDDGEGNKREMPDQLASGSGFFIDGGYIVTNNHVVDGAKKVTVVFEGGKEVDATVVGKDPKTDLAVVKIDAKYAPQALKWGDSSKARVGDSVFAIGSPFGLGNTVTAGIISARSRNIGSGPYDDYFQVDVPINQGNSGGPLINAEGHVIGINSAIYSPTGGSVGIGFSIPSEEAQAVVSQIISHGAVERGWLGVGIQDVTPDIAKSFGLDEAKGALVGEVTPNSPAAKAGIRAQDIILGFDGKDIKSRTDLTRMVGNTKAGDSKPMRIMRDGKMETVSVKIAPLEDTSGKDKDKPSAPKLASATEGKSVTLPGLGLQLSDSEGSTVVSDVKINSAAADAQIQQGDKLLMVNQTEIKSAADAQRVVADAKQRHREAVMLQLDRKGQKVFVGVPFSAN